MRKIKMLFEAVLILGITLAFVMPGTAMVTEQQAMANEKSHTFILPEILGMNRGWIEQASGFWEASRGIDYMCAVDENIVWAKNYDGSGGGMLTQEFTRTTNGGDLWEADAIFGAPEDGDLAMIFGLDADHAWVPIHSGDPQGIWATSNGGDTWAQQTTADYNGVGAFPNIVHFWDENNGWCQGDPVDGYFEMYTTTNGGTTWTRVPSEDIPAPYSGEYGVVGYYDVVGDTVWWGTANAYPLRVFKSTDRGYTWTAYDTPFDAGAYIDVRFKDQMNGLAMDKTADGVGPIAETSDGGETWTLIDYTGTCYNADFDYVPGTDNMYVSTGVFTNDPALQGASYSLDGGHSWSTWPTMEGIQLFGTTWIEGEIGWAGSFNTDEFTGGVYKYTPDDNEPPEVPSITGQTHGNAGTEYTYTFNSEDPDGDDVYYYIMWGDGYTEVWDGPHASGADADIAHTYANQGEFTIQAKAKDTNGAESDWGELVVTMPRNKAVNFPFFLRILENHPNLFPVLRQLLGL
jgi:photosystem II stability/assembly factor-like uncharacterized protein